LLMITGALLWLALVGLVACTVFLGLVLVAVRRHLRRQSTFSFEAPLPPVTLLKPLHGLEPELERNLESFFVQDYPDFEIIFGARDGNDPALTIVRKLHQRHPKVKAKIVISGNPDKPNAKICSLDKMDAAASNVYLVISDSDVRVEPNYLREVVLPLLDPKVGLVTCLYRGVPTGGLWSRLEALGMSVEMTSGVVVADMLEGMRFALGPTMAVRRDALEKAGGFGALSGYCADDYVLGKRIFEAGYRVVLSHHVIDHIVLGRSFRSSALHQVRWMKSTRFSRPAGHIGAGLTYAMPFGLLGMIVALVTGHWWLGAGFLAWAVLNRVVMAIASGLWVVRDRRALQYCWLYPVRDFTGFCFWCASFFGNTIVWRGERYRLEQDGKMARVGGPPAEPSSSGPVTVDNLA
jgi:ceramide glucosyltransferase